MMIEHFRNMGMDLKTQVLMELAFARGYMCCLDDGCDEQKFINMGDMLAQVQDGICKYLTNKPDHEVNEND